MTNSIRTKAGRSAANRRARRVALGVGVAIAGIQAITLIGMLARIVPFEQRPYLAPEGWAGLYFVLSTPGAFLAYTISLGAIDHWPHWSALVLLFVMNGVAWYAIARAMIWTVSETRAAFRAR